ncbi:MAG: PIN domain-containing protein [Promethearchaeota archaeon]
MKDDAIVVDTGILIEFFENSKIGIKFFEEFIKNKKYNRFIMSPLTDLELKYIFCRRMGIKNAIELISNFIKDFFIPSEEMLRNEAAKIKCKYPISIADSYSLAAAKILNVPLCMKREREILEHFNSLSQEIKIILIES